MTDNKAIAERGVMTVLGAWISNQLGMLLPAVGLLIFLILMDYISGMLAAKKEAFEHLDRKCGWSSKRSILGIYKKVGYMLTVLVAVCIDYLIFRFAKEMGAEFGTNTVFGLLVTIWFIINEIISILENVGRMGTELPRFLKKVLAELKNDLDDKKL